MAMAQGSGNAFFKMILAAAALLLQVAIATEFKVGGKAGWGLPSFTNVNYTDWAPSNKYHMGDTLVFDYNNQAHNVLIVNKVDFVSCSTLNPIATFQDGHTVINLNKTGPHYYICGVPGHCAQGQKLLVTVRGRAKHAASPTAAPAKAPHNGAFTSVIPDAVVIAVSVAILAALI